MAAVTYRPGPHDPASVEWQGIRFPANVPVDVSNAHILKKAEGNPFFDLERAPPPPPDEPEPDEKDALTAEAEALGIEVDRRWGIARLKAAIEEKKAES